MVPHWDVVHNIAGYEVTIGFLIETGFNSGFLSSLGRTHASFPEITHRMVFILVDMHHLDEHLELRVVELEMLSQVTGLHGSASRQADTQP